MSYIWIDNDNGVVTLLFIILIIIILLFFIAHTNSTNSNNNNLVLLMHSVKSCVLNELFYLQTGDTAKLPLLCHYPVKVCSSTHELTILLFSVFLYIILMLHFCHNHFLSLEVINLFFPFSACLKYPMNINKINKQTSIVHSFNAHSETHKCHTNYLGNTSEKFAPLAN